MVFKLLYNVIFHHSMFIFGLSKQNIFLIGICAFPYHQTNQGCSEAQFAGIPRAHIVCYCYLFTVAEAHICITDGTKSKHNNNL